MVPIVPKTGSPLKWSLAAWSWNIIPIVLALLITISAGIFDHFKFPFCAPSKLPFIIVVPWGCNVIFEELLGILLI